MCLLRCTIMSLEEMYYYQLSCLLRICTTMCLLKGCTIMCLMRSYTTMSLEEMHCHVS